jgi:hypothetical protein
MVTDNIIASILKQIDFMDEMLLQKVEAVVAASTSFARAGLDFDLAYSDDSGEVLAASILRLSENFALIPSPDKRKEVQDDFKAVFAPEDQTQESAGEMLFVASLDFTVAATELNDLIKERLMEAGEG